MPANYVLLGKETVGAVGVASVTFNSIPQTGYTDLVLVTSTRSNTAEDSLNVRINNDSATNYTNVQINGNGSTAATSSFTQGAVGGGRQPESGYTANTFGNCKFYFPNYTSSANKSVSVEAVNENNATTVRTQFTSSVYPQTTAISSLVVATGSGLFVQHSTFCLYGVAKFAVTPTIAPFATGGDVIDNDGTYFYHAFRSSGTFTPLKALSCDVLVVAGGGGGRYGGGGGGGYRSSASALSVSTTTNITVGGGGAEFTKGSNSVFSTITSTGGGRGGDSSGGSVPETGGTGGSGGGSYSGSGSRSGGIGNEGGFTPVEGFAGGASSGGRGSGGGGASAVGGISSGGVAGVGGSGSNAHSSWATVTGTGVSGYYAGGGGGYDASGVFVSGGAGGGGNGQGISGGANGGNAGTVNTGGGGGTPGHAGGSGIVIIRYPMV